MKCSNCSFSNFRTEYQRADGRQIMSCQCCSYAFVFPMPTKQELAAIYSASYFDGRSDFHSDGSYLDSRKNLSDPSILTGWSFINKHVDVRGKRVLEIGCADGAVLFHLRQKGACLVAGVEISSTMIEYAKRTSMLMS
jgi:2-polyprenyl-3-methyl-5-hydroxy-6-metoxy-1,4-benzoquinol methylase